MAFQNRKQAGKKLAEKLLEYKGRKDLVVLGIPRGGVVIAKELAIDLICPLDIIVTKKIGAPGNSELAIGAVGDADESVINKELTALVGASEEYLKAQIAKLKTEVARRTKEYRGNKPPLDLKDKIVIITDDGLATGATMAAAVEVIRQQQPKKIVVAIPVAARDSLKKIEAKVAKVVYLEAPLMFFAVGQFYEDFPQVSDNEVVELLRG